MSSVEIKILGFFVVVMLFAALSLIVLTKNLKELCEEEKRRLKKMEDDGK